MQKVIFDIEDRPPASYYKEMAKMKLETGALSGSGIDHKIDKTDWCNAPEFVPRSQTLAATLNDCKENAFPDVPNAAKLTPVVTNDSPHEIVQQYKQPLRPVSMQIPRFPVQFNPVMSLHQNIMRPIVPDAFNCSTPVQHSPMMPTHMITMSPQPRPLFQVQPTMQLISHRPQYCQPSLLHVGPNVLSRTVGFPAMLPTNLSGGYTANIATIKSALGPQLPAIVIKKKRKKKPKFKKDASIDEQTSTNLEKSFNNHCDQTSKESSPDDCSAATESLNDKTTSTHSDSEPTEFAKQDVLQSSLDSESLKATPNGSFYPADLDLIQNCAILSGSWPDLSEPQRKSLQDAANGDFCGAYYHNRCHQHDNVNGNYGSKGSLQSQDEEEEQVKLLLRSPKNANDMILNENPYSNRQKTKNLIIHSSANGGPKSEILNEDGDGVLGFLPYQLRTLSMPDVHLITTKAQRVCCSIM